MAPTPTTGGSPTSSDLCRRALRAYEHLYRLLDCDDPDLAANVTFTAGRIRLLRLSAAAPWEVAEPAARDLVELIERAERARRPADAEPLFATFVEEVCRRLERRRPPSMAPASLLGRRAADRFRQAVSVEPERPGAPAAPAARDVVTLRR